MNWMDKYKPLVREEAKYLERDKDLVSLSTGDDRGKFDEIVEWLLDRCTPPFITTRVRDHFTYLCFFPANVLDDNLRASGLCFPGTLLSKSSKLRFLTVDQSTRAFTSDKNIHLYNPDRVQRLPRVAITIIVVMLLLIPIIVLYHLHTDRQKFLTIIFSTVIFAALLALTTKAKKAEIFAATAA